MKPAIADVSVVAAGPTCAPLTVRPCELVIINDAAPEVAVAFSESTAVVPDTDLMNVPAGNMVPLMRGGRRRSGPRPPTGSRSPR